MYKISINLQSNRYYFFRHFYFFLFLAELLAFNTSQLCDICSNSIFVMNLPPKIPKPIPNKPNLNNNVHLCTMYTGYYVHQVYHVHYVLGTLYTVCTGYYVHQVYYLDYAHYVLGTLCTMYTRYYVHQVLCTRCAMYTLYCVHCVHCVRQVR